MLDLACAAFLEERGIDVELATKYGVYTANISDLKGQPVLVFPYTEDGQLVNEKFRLLPKQRFWQHSGRRKIFWNVDVLKDPALEIDGTHELLITEGEMDALAAIQSGYPFAVSVPDGAPPAGPRDTSDHSGSDDQDGKFSFMWNARERLKRIHRFILATDNDGPGQRLRDELITRLSAVRCSFVEYPAGCKDLNDVLIKHGEGAVSRVINTAKPCPVRGLYRFSDYPDAGPLQTFTAGFPYLERNLKIIPGEFMVITGIPQHGKSSFVLHLLSNLAVHHGWRAALFSPEMKVVPIVRDRMMQIRYGAGGYTPEQWAWLEDTFLFIGADPRREAEEEPLDLEFILDKASDAILRDGIKVLVIDPWNEVEHARRRDETLTEYVSRGIRMLKSFAMKNSVTVIVVAHPTKMEREKDGTYRMPSLYDISDSAAWFNKCDHGLVIHRNFENLSTEAAVVKSRFDEAGEPGSVRMRFNARTHRFEPLDVAQEDTL